MVAPAAITTRSEAAASAGSDPDGLEPRSVRALPPILTDLSCGPDPAEAQVPGVDDVEPAPPQQPQRQQRRQEPPVVLLPPPPTQRRRLQQQPSPLPSPQPRQQERQGQDRPSQCRDEREGLASQAWPAQRREPGASTMQTFPPAQPQLPPPPEALQSPQLPQQPPGRQAEAVPPTGRRPEDARPVLQRVCDSNPVLMAPVSAFDDSGPGPPPPPAKLPPPQFAGSSQQLQQSRGWQRTVAPLREVGPSSAPTNEGPAIRLPGPGASAVAAAREGKTGKGTDPIPDASVAKDMVTVGRCQGRTAGAAFRAALRGCRSLAQVEALLEGHEPSMPAAEALSVPSLTAVFSALPRLPESANAAGRRRVQRLLASRLSPLVALSARRGELDAAGAAIMAAALAQLGPNVADPRVGRSDLVDVLAEAGLAACRLPLDPPSWEWREDGGFRAGSRVNDTAFQEPDLKRNCGHGSQQFGAALAAAAQQQQPSRRRRYGHSPRSYSTLLYALAKLGYRPDDLWLDRYLAASVPWLRSFPPRDLAASVWAVAVMQYRPGEAWLSALLSAWPTGRSPVGDDPYGEAGRGQRGNHDDKGENDDPWVGSLIQAKPRADAHSLSLLLWALWRLGVAAPPDWLDGALAVCAVPAAAAGLSVVSLARGSKAPFPAATCQSLGLVCYSLARMGHTPQARVRQALLAAAPPLLQGGSAQDLVLLLVGVAHWPRGVVAAAATATTSSASEAAFAGSQQWGSDPASAAGGAAAAADDVVPAGWLQQLCGALRPRLGPSDAQALVLSLSALSHLGYSPGAMWLAEHEAALRPLISTGRLDGRAAARVAAAWARLRHRPGRNVVDRLLKILVAAAAGGSMYGSGAAAGAAAAAASAQQGPSLSARLFAEGLYGIAVLVAARKGGDAPSDRPPALRQAPLLATIHLRALLGASQSRLPYSYLDQALLHLRAWRLLRLAPPHQWLANLAAVARGAKLNAAPPAVLLQLLSLLAWPGWALLREPHLHAAQERSQAVSAASGVGVLAVSAAFVGALAARLAPVMTELTLPQLEELAAALVALRVRPSRGWLLGLLEALRRRLRSDQDRGVRLKPRGTPDGDAAAPEVASERELVMAFWSETETRPHLYQAEGGGCGGGDRAVSGLPAGGPRALHAAAQLAAAVGDPGIVSLAEALLAEHGVILAGSRTAAAAGAAGGARGPEMEADPHGGDSQVAAAARGEEHAPAAAAGAALPPLQAVTAAL